MKIIALHDGGSGCMYYRIRLPLEALAANGHDVTFLGVSDAGGESRVKYGAGVTVKIGPAVPSNLQGYDVVIGQRVNLYTGLASWRSLRGPFNRLVYENDDDVFSIRPENWNAWRTYRDPAIRDAVIHSAEVSDLITVSTQPLADVMGEYNPNVAVLKNCVPDWLPEMNRFAHNRPCLGWGGGVSHGSDIGLIAAPVRDFLAKFPGWDLRLMGTDFRPTFKSDRAYFRRWIPINDNPRGYYHALRMDIGLAPLAGTAFDQSKSFVKVLEYAALGIPSVASDFGPYPEFVRHGENGFLASTEDQWLEYLSLLASDDALRAKLGAAAREDARAWTIGRHWKQWADAYEALFNRRTP